MTDERDFRLTRRAFLGIIAAAGATACTGAVTIERTPRGSAAPATLSPAPPVVATPPSPDPGEAVRAGAYEPIDGETYPDAKRVAGRFAVALLTYDEQMRPKPFVRRLARAAGDTFDARALRRRAERLLVPGAISSAQVVYPQLGGLTVGSGTDRASVMVVVAQQLREAGGAATTVTRTLDVRLVRRGQHWRVEELADAGGGPPRDAPDLPGVARRVLDEPRIELPDSARWDILSGGIDERLLRTMLDLATVAPYSVTVLKSGHPHNVFGTDNVSGHTYGRGVDIWRIDGRPVVLQRDSTQSPAHEFTARALKEFEVPELGSPWDLDGPPEPGESKPSFTDAVHADHIHVAFKAP